MDDGPMTPREALEALGFRFRWERPDPHSFRSVLVPLAGADRRGDLVMLWADEVAERHGDVSPAEVLAEARAAEVAP